MISCDNHDYVEIACMYRIEVKLGFKDGKVVQGVALQTTYNEKRKECIVIKTKFRDELFVLDQVVLMEAITTNLYFDKVRF